MAGAATTRADSTYRIGDPMRIRFVTPAMIGVGLRFQG